jgi:hypothetical protein
MILEALCRKAYAIDRYCHRFSSAHHGTGLRRPPIIKLHMPSSTEERLKEDAPFPAGGFSLSFRPVFRMRKLLSRACGDSFVAKTIVFYFQASAMAGLSGLWGGCCVKARAMGCQVATTTLKIRTLRGPLPLPSRPRLCHTLSANPQSGFEDRDSIHAACRSMEPVRL